MPPDIGVLQQLNQIKSITPLADNRFRIEHDGTSDQFAEEFAQFAVDRRWGLFELLPEHDSLEAIFIRLTGSDAAERHTGKQRGSGMSTVTAIAGNELRRLFVSPLAWMALAAVQLVLAIFFFVMLYQFQNMPGTAQTGATNFVGAGVLQVTGHRVAADRAVSDHAAAER
ncbi:MAG: hypothetical protein U5P41_02165 [Gammaproteobacteria bacterium]|nr:hypothetical protein [Gammaproteobacteria bacterium]